MPISFIIGATDFVLYCDNHDELNMHWGEILIKKNQKKFGNKNCQYHLCPSAGHNMQWDNAEALVKIIINDYMDFESTTENCD
jgi:pimeloyl-ACP methyl ester carboxylesterase